MWLPELRASMTGKDLTKEIVTIRQYRHKTPIHRQRSMNYDIKQTMVTRLVSPSWAVSAGFPSHFWYRHRRSPPALPSKPRTPSAPSIGCEQLHAVYQPQPSGFVPAGSGKYYWNILFNSRKHHGYQSTPEWSGIRDMLLRKSVSGLFTSTSRLPWLCRRQVNRYMCSGPGESLLEKTIWEREIE